MLTNQLSIGVASGSSGCVGASLSSGQTNLERASAIRSFAQWCDRAPVVFDDSVSNAESQPSALPCVSRREEWIENVLQRS